MAKMTEELYYRYESSLTERDGGCLSLHEYPVIGHTPKCVRLGGTYHWRGYRMVLKDPVGKRFAYATKEAALQGFYHRKRRQALILAHQQRPRRAGQGPRQADDRGRADQPLRDFKWGWNVPAPVDREEDRHEDP
jgi:hypothetical protein